MRRSRCLVLMSLLALPAQSFGQAPLICLGNEPSWGVDLTAPGTARFTAIGETPVTYRGNATARR
jgi:hypothetical protein